MTTQQLLEYHRVFLPPTINLTHFNTAPSILGVLFFEFDNILGPKLISQYPNNILDTLHHDVYHSADINDNDNSDSDYDVDINSSLHQTPNTLEPHPDSSNINYSLNIAQFGQSFITRMITKVDPTAINPNSSQNPQKTTFNQQITRQFADILLNSSDFSQTVYSLHDIFPLQSIYSQSSPSRSVHYDIITYPIIIHKTFYYRNSFFYAIGFIVESGHGGNIDSLNNLNFYHSLMVELSRWVYLLEHTRGFLQGQTLRWVEFRKKLFRQQTLHNAVAMAGVSSFTANTTLGSSADQNGTHMGVVNEIGSVSMTTSTAPQSQSISLYQLLDKLIYRQYIILIINNIVIKQLFQINQGYTTLPTGLNFATFLPLLYPPPAHRPRTLPTPIIPSNVSNVQRIINRMKRNQEALSFSQGKQSHIIKNISTNDEFSNNTISSTLDSLCYINPTILHTNFTPLINNYTNLTNSHTSFLSAFEQYTTYYRRLYSSQTASYIVQSSFLHLKSLSHTNPFTPLPTEARPFFNPSVPQYILPPTFSLHSTPVRVYNTLNAPALHTIARNHLTHSPGSSQLSPLLIQTVFDAIDDTATLAQILFRTQHVTHPLVFITALYALILNGCVVIIDAVLLSSTYILEPFWETAIRAYFNTSIYPPTNSIKITNINSSPPFGRPTHYCTQFVIPLSQKTPNTLSEWCSPRFNSPLFPPVSIIHSGEDPSPGQFGSESSELPQNRPHTQDKITHTSQLQIPQCSAPICVTLIKQALAYSTITTSPTGPSYSISQVAKATKLLLALLSPAYSLSQYKKLQKSKDSIITSPFDTLPTLSALWEALSIPNVNPIRFFTFFLAHGLIRRVNVTLSTPAASVPSKHIFSLLAAQKRYLMSLTSNLTTEKSVTQCIALPNSPVQGHQKVSPTKDVNIFLTSTQLTSLNQAIYFEAKNGVKVNFLNTHRFGPTTPLSPNLDPHDEEKVIDSLLSNPSSLGPQSGLNKPQIYPRHHPQTGEPILAPLTSTEPSSRLLRADNHHNVNNETPTPLFHSNRMIQLLCGHVYPQSPQSWVDRLNYTVYYTFYKNIRIVDRTSNTSQSPSSHISMYVPHLSPHVIEKLFLREFLSVATKTKNHLIAQQNDNANAINPSQYQSSGCNSLQNTTDDFCGQFVKMFHHISSEILKNQASSSSQLFFKSAPQLPPRPQKRTIIARHIGQYGALLAKMYRVVKQTKKDNNSNNDVQNINQVPPPASNLTTDQTCQTTNHITSHETPQTHDTSISNSSPVGLSANHTFSTLYNHYIPILPFLTESTPSPLICGTLFGDKHIKSSEMLFFNPLTHSFYSPQHSFEFLCFPFTTFRLQIDKYTSLSFNSEELQKNGISYQYRVQKAQLEQELLSFIAYILIYSVNLYDVAMLMDINVKTLIDIIFQVYINVKAQCSTDATIEHDNLLELLFF